MADQPRAAVLGAGHSGRTWVTILSQRFRPIAIWEPDPDTGRGARRQLRDVVVTADLETTVANATLVVVTTHGQVRSDVLSRLAPLLAHGAIVIIDGVGHETALAQCAHSLPAHVNVLAVTIIPSRVRAEAFDDEASKSQTRFGRRRSVSSENAQEHILSGDACGITVAPNAHPDAVGVVHALVDQAGGRVWFGDASEIDSQATAALILPSLVGGALVRAVLGEEGMRDFDRSGGVTFASMTDVVDDEHAASDLLNVREHAVRWLDRLAAELALMRAGLTNPDGNVSLDATRDRRRAWLEARQLPPELSILPDAPPPTRRRLFF